MADRARPATGPDAEPAARPGDRRTRRADREAGFGAMLRTSCALCLVTALLALAAFAVYQLYRWLF